MRSEVLILALLVGLCTWAFRYVPLRARLGDIRADSLAGRFFAATGPAAIAALFVAAIMPYAAGSLADLGPLGAGVIAVVGVFYGTRSVVLATLAGSAAFGIVTALMPL